MITDGTHILPSYCGNESLQTEPISSHIKDDIVLSLFFIITPRMRPVVVKVLKSYVNEVSLGFSFVHGRSKSQSKGSRRGRTPVY